MPIPPKDPAKKQQAPPAGNSGGTPPPKQSPVPDEKQAAPPPKQPEKKTPAQEKDDRFKYDMTYVNGGFNNGVEVKPDKDGKANVEISIYGGGQKKTLSISPLPPNIKKLVKAYELSATQNEDSPEITEELQKYFAQVQTLLNAKILEIFKQADLQIATAIKETFKQVNQDHST